MLNLNKILITPWLIVILLSLSGVIYYNYSIWIVLILVLEFYLFVKIGSYCGELVFLRKHKKSDIQSYRKINTLLRTLAFVWSIVFILDYLMAFGLSIDLNKFQNVRYGYEEVSYGSNSILKNLRITLNAVPFYYVLYSLLGLKSTLTKLEIIENSLFLTLGILSLLVGGGRNSVVVVLILFFVLNTVVLKVSGKKHYQHLKSRFLRLRKIIKVVFAISALFIFFVFFLRITLKNENYNMSKRAYYTEFNTADVNINDNVEKIIYSENCTYCLMTEIYVNVHYYLTHSIYELGRSYNYDSNKYYMGKYQFYPFISILNTLGTDLKGIDEILSEIKNPGKYFTLIGAMKLDYGVYAFVIYFFLGGLYGYFKRMYLTEYSIFSIINLTLLTLVFIFAPFYSVLGIGVFFSFILLSLIIKLFSKI